MTKFQRTLLISAAAVLVVYTIQSFIGIRFYYKKSWCMCPQVPSPPKNDYFRYIQAKTERPFGAQASNTKNIIRTTSEFLIERVTSDLSVDSRLTTAAATVIDENTTAKPISTAKTVNYCPEVSPLLQGNVVVPSKFSFCSLLAQKESEK